MQFISRLSNASAFAHKLQAEAGNDFIRCPYLANLEIERRKHLQGRGDDDKLIEALMQYFLRYISTLILIYLFDKHLNLNISSIVV